jgi:hypothetical protein
VSSRNGAENSLFADKCVSVEARTKIRSGTKGTAWGRHARLRQGAQPSGSPSVTGRRCNLFEHSCDESNSLNGVVHCARGQGLATGHMVWPEAGKCQRQISNKLGPIPLDRGL